MNDQTTGKLSEEELLRIRDSLGRDATRVGGDRLFGHIAYQDAKIERLTKQLAAALGNLRTAGIEATDPATGIYTLAAERAGLQGEVERLTKELGEATAKLDGLKVDPAKRDELIAECHRRFQSGFPEEYRFVWLAQGEQFRAGFAAAIGHAFAAGSASAPEVAELQRQLEDEHEVHVNHLANYEEQIAELTAKLEHFDRRTKNRDEWKEVALRLEADRDRLAAELAAEKQNHQATAELLGLVAAELGEAKQAIAKIVDIRSKIFLCDETLDLAIREAKLLLEKSAAPLTAAEFAELGKVLDAEAADHSGDAAKKVERPASEARRFVCPKCGGTEHGTRSDYSIYCLRGYALGCGWFGTWAEVEAAKGRPPASDHRFTCPKCGGHFCERLLDGSTRCLGVGVLAWSGCPAAAAPEPGSMQIGEMVDFEAADRQVTEKILELERRCNDEHFKCEAAEAERDGLKVRLNDFERSPDEKQKSIWDLEQMASDAEERANNIARMLHAEKQRAEQAEAAAGLMREVIERRLASVTAVIEKGKGTWPEPDYIRDDAWQRFVGEMYCLRGLLETELPDAGRAAAKELRALRAFRAEIEQDYQAWANATIGEAELRIRLGVARNKVDKAIAGQGAAGKDGR